VPALLADLSHWNATPTPDQLKAAGVAGVVLKATDGTGYVDPTFAARRDLYGAAGLAVGAYHFAELGDPIVEADHFAAVLGGMRPGEFVGLDMERAGGDPVAFSVAFLDRLGTHFAGEVRLEYLNKSFLAAHDWSPVAARGVELWLADYNGTQTTAGSPAGAFGTVTLKQYSDKGRVAGFVLDVDWLPGQLSDLTGGGVAPAPQPQPAPQPAPAFDCAAWVTRWRASAGQPGHVFALLQAWANATFPSYAHIGPLADAYGPQTVAFLRAFARRAAADPSYPGGHGDLAGADGRNIGNNLAAALVHYGFAAYLARAGFTA
jgi:lysozyme